MAASRVVHRVETCHLCAQNSALNHVHAELSDVPAPATSFAAYRVPLQGACDTCPGNATLNPFENTRKQLNHGVESPQDWLPEASTLSS